MVLFGYPTNYQWQALNKYEKASFGMICEDYEREAPMELRRYPSAITQSPRNSRSRPLTQAERSKSFRYAGGAHWIKITFDSAEAAERAAEISPLPVNGYWVYAAPWHGLGPENDEAIAITESERVEGKPLQKHTLRPSQSFNQNTQGTDPTQTGGITAGAGASPSGSNNTSPTASSGTATGLPSTRPQPSTPNFLRNRRTNDNNNTPANGSPLGPGGQRMMRRFPNEPRTILRPAHEAFLPQPTWWERQLRYLSERGLIPGEIIGNGPPIREDNGELDWTLSNWYWRVWWMVDSWFGTDFCGLRRDEDDEE